MLKVTERCIETLSKGVITNGCFLDCYNKKIYKDKCGTILTGISFRNMHYVVVIE